MTAEIGRRNLMGAGLLGAAALSGLPTARADATGKPDPTEPPSPAGQTALSPPFDPRIAEEIIAHAKALEAAEAAKSPEDYAKLIPEDYTEISSHFLPMVKGRDEAKKLQEFAKAAPQKIVCSFLTHPKVQVFGDVAILLYISLGVVMDGVGRGDPACRRVTRIYARQDGSWTLVHSHFSSFDYRSTY
jgi:ketosteroid isomerase-like protein